MPWKETTVDQLAENLGLNAAEVREKQKLIQQIIKARKQMGLSQTDLAAKLGVTQGRVAQIESGVGTRKVTFDVLLHILSLLGYEFKIVSKRAA